MPQPEKQLDVIKVTGLVANVERAKQGLLERVKELQAEQEDRVRNKTLDCHHLLNIAEYLGHYKDICELLLLLFRLSAASRSPCLSIQSFIPKSSAARGRSSPRSGKTTMSASSSLIKETRSRCVCIMANTGIILSSSSYSESLHCLLGVSYLGPDCDIGL